MSSPGGPPEYVSRRTVAESYRPKGLMSPGLQRAREPYRFKNAISGLILGAIGVGIWAYSIQAVKQDVFDDVDEEARELREAGVVLTSLEDEERDRKRAAASGSGDYVKLGKPVEPTIRPVVVAAVTQRSRRGVLTEMLEESYPDWLHPQNRTLVWGAPPVDNIGKMGDWNGEAIGKK